MIFSQLIAFPESRRILKMHLLATPFLAAQWAVVAMVPVLLRSHFQASKWQVTISTSAVSLLLLLSILWNEIYRRMDAARYLLLLWVVGIAPLAGVAMCHQPETALVFIVLSAIGFGAMTPFTGDIIRSCYPPAVRSRVFGVLQVLARSTIMVGTYALGVWLEVDAEAFRKYLPGGVIVVGAGMFLLARIARQPLFKERHRSPPADPLWSSLTRTLHSMLAVFARDRVFRRYEEAFFVYGLGWMICYALLPFLVVDELGLNYEQVARATQTTFELVLILAVMPVGYLMDRLGPIRLASWAFAILGVYPVGLMLAVGVQSLTAATAIFALGISGVHLAWTIGPVTLAKDASQAPHYLAIHATLVGFRALIGQFPAVALYQWTDCIELPLGLAILLFAAGALLMLRLERDRRLEPVVELPVVPVPPPHSRLS